MEYELMGGLMIVWILLWVAWVMVSANRRHRRAERFGQQRELLPPGPRWWPVVGNMFQLVGAAPHEAFARLARKHGAIMTLWLGSMGTVVVSSSGAAREMFKSHDAALAGRKIYESMKGEHGTEGSLITSQYGAHWRMLRRLATTEFFVTSRLDAMRGVRGACVERMVGFVEDASAGGTKAVDVGRFFFLMNFNLIGNLMFSKDLLDPRAERGKRFFYHAGKVMEFAGKPNVADFLPLLRWLDPQRIRRNTQYHVDRAFEIAGGFIKERMEKIERDSEDRKKDFLDVLLGFRGDGVEEPASKFSPRTINVIVFEMFTAGTDTTTSTMEWAMAELLHKPEAMRKVQSELRSAFDPTRKLRESDMETLPYLKAVIKETLRLHPPLPFLVPHMAMDTCQMLGYHIPKETQILVNVWAIGRDPETWVDPMEFKPERFLKSDTMPDFRGQHFEFIPFGSGRRMCPAVPLVSRLLPLALGSLLLKFDWVLPDGADPTKMNMAEKMGITLRKAVPLKVIPRPYVIH